MCDSPATVNMKVTTMTFRVRLSPSALYNTKKRKRKKLKEIQIDFSKGGNFCVDNIKLVGGKGCSIIIIEQS